MLFHLNDKPDASLSLRMPSGLRSALQAEANENGRTLSGEINFRLAKSLETQSARERQAS